MCTDLFGRGYSSAGTKVFLEGIANSPKCRDSCIEFVPNHTGVFGRVSSPVTNKYRYCRYCGRAHTGTRGISEWACRTYQECRVPVSRWYRTYPSVPYRYRVINELTEVSGNRIRFVPNHTGRFRGVLRPYRTNTGTPGILVKGIPVSGVYLSARTELTEFADQY